MSKKSSKRRMKLKFKKDSLLGKLIIVFILLIIVLNVLRYAAYFKKEDNSQLSVIIQNNTNVEMQHDVYIDENKIVYFSEDDMRNLFDKELYYEKDEDNLRRYISISQSKILEITEEKNHMYINGTFTKIKGKVINRDGIYYFPISELADVYNLEVDYLSDTNKLNIEKLSEEKVTAIVNRDTELKYKMTAISRNVEKLSQGDTVTVLDSSDKKWIKVKTKDYQVGYVKKSKLLDFTKARNDLELANSEFSNFDLKNDVVIEYLKKQDQGHIYDPSRCVVKLGRAKPVGCVGQVHDVLPDTSRFRCHDHGDHGRDGKDTGCKEEDLSMLADKAMQDPCKPGNPREVSKEDFIRLFREAM